MALDNSVILHEFAPIYLHIDRIGPFQDRLEVFDLSDAQGHTCNYFLIFGYNGRGKTHVLELMAHMMGILGQDPDAPPPCFGHEPLDKGRGRAQWDILLRYSTATVKARTTVLSIFAGQSDGETWLKTWTDTELAEFGADEHHRIGVIRDTMNRYEWVGLDDRWSRDFLDWIRSHQGDSLDAFLGSSFSPPTLLYFSAYRDVLPIPREAERAAVSPYDWNYRPLHIFRNEGKEWQESLDNLLVWLAWLDDGRYEAALELINEYVFKGSGKHLAGIDRQRLCAVIDCGNEPVSYRRNIPLENIGDERKHRLDQLSSGEKSLLQLFLRIGVHMTANTILLIDEVDAHLHVDWQARIGNRLKSLVKDNSGLSIFLASHSEEIMKSAAWECPEDGLRKNGFLIETAEEEERAERIRREAQLFYGKLDEEGV
jgi:ABC-type transport system involved in cytochrome c biogenesis ATPase subunit